MAAGQTSPLAPQTTIIFLHIPKCAGVTLIGVLENMFPPESRFQTDGFRVKESIGELICMPREERERIDILMGHMPFGLHRHLPNPARYITVLRNPVDRVVSFYYFAREFPQHYMHEDILTRNLSLEDVMRLGLSGELDNEMTKILSGVEDVPFGQCTEGLFQKAKRHLRDHFELVGILKRFDETLISLKNILGWKREPLYETRNVTRGRPVWRMSRTKRFV